MNIKQLTLIAAIAATMTSTVFAQESATAQKIDSKTPEATAADEKAKALEAQLESELNKSADSNITTAAAEPTTLTPEPAPNEDPLIQQYRLRKNKNFKAVEFELAKELAINRNSKLLEDQEQLVNSAALTSLSTAIGVISEPQKEETYFDYQENYETGEFVVVLLKDTYVKSERGDVCLIATQVHLRTSIQAELSNPDSAAPTKTPTTVTDIECYNDERPSYSQRVVN